MEAPLITEEGPTEKTVGEDDSFVDVMCNCDCEMSDIGETKGASGKGKGDRGEYEGGSHN